MKKSVLALILVLSFALTSYAGDNWALEFNGVDDYITIPDSDIWKFGLSDFTMDAWVFLGIDDKERLSIASRGATKINGWGFKDGHEWLWTITTSNMTFFWYVGKEGRSRVTGEISINANEWYHVAVVRNGPKISLYLDGALIGENHIDCIYATTADRIIIGAHDNLSWPFNGRMDEFRIWNYGMTEAQVKKWMHASPDGNNPSLSAYWNFNEGTGTIAYDSTSCGNDACLHGIKRLKKSSK